MSTVSDLKKQLESIDLAEFGRPLGDIARVISPRLTEAGFSAKVEFGLPLGDRSESLRESVLAALVAADDLPAVDLDISSRIVPHAVQGSLKPVDGISNIIAVASGKGGVGKSTVAANLALALAAEGAAVGMLDADIYGPSQPELLGIAGESPDSHDGKTMQPLLAHGIKVMSIGFLVDPDQAMVWRGPMVTSALNQLMHQTEWGNLDYLIVDMPPGTGDIQLTLAQKIPVSGAVIVTTPQNIATRDARRGLSMFRKVSIPVLGVVENMASHICSKCGHADPIFGAGGAERIVEDFDVALLGRLPLQSAIREHCDAGRPTVISEPESPAGVACRQLARRVAAEQAAQRSDYSHKFGNIVVEDGT